MSAHAILELPEPESPSMWPWLVALLAGGALLLTVAQQASAIPTALKLQVDRERSRLGATDVTVVVDGRDVALGGSVPLGFDRDDLVSRLSAIKGVRVVRDDISTIDPRAVEQERLQAFTDMVNSLDLSAVAFDPGKTTFANGSEDALGQLLQILRGSPDNRIRISGHTDNTGRPEVNLRLSKERAAAVADYLTARGVSRDQVIATGYGASQPIADNASEQGRSRNRRIEISYVD